MTEHYITAMTSSDSGWLYYVACRCGALMEGEEEWSQHLKDTRTRAAS